MVLQKGSVHGPTILRKQLHILLQNFEEVHGLLRAPEGGLNITYLYNLIYDRGISNTTV